MSTLAQSWAVFSGRIGLDRRSSPDGIPVDQDAGSLTSPSLVAASKRASNSVSMFWTTFRLKRSLACLVKVIVSDLAAHPCSWAEERWVGETVRLHRRSWRNPVTCTPKLYRRTQLRARRNYSDVSLIVATHA